ncbi:MAG: hypothetical protein ABJA57_07740 [Ginsengibacter sp.]
MLTTTEKTFIRHWQEQKEGPRWKYYLQYIIAWMVVIFLSLLFILKLMMAERDMGGLTSFYIVLPLSVVLAVVTTHLVYQKNEKKLQRLLQKQNKGNGQ